VLWYVLYERNTPLKSYLLIERRFMDFSAEKIIDRQKVASTIHQILDSGIEMLQKDTLTKDDFSKIKLIRVISSPLNAGVGMVQQETAQQRNVLISERMKQIGYSKPKEIAAG
jgi:lantibiotic modifying enzyme|tara:strand:- start:47 stop:385 length:339 start_codon:yes stop_codon:yes gene_type:complete